MSVTEDTPGPPGRPTRVGPPNVGLVLGAGGTVGAAYHGVAGSTFRRRPTSLLHRRIQQTLHHELSSLPSGTAVRVFSPGHESREAMGLDLMSEDRASSTILAGFLEAGAPLPA